MVTSAFSFLNWMLCLYFKDVLQGIFFHISAFTYLTLFLISYLISVGLFFYLVVIFLGGGRGRGGRGRKGGRMVRNLRGQVFIDFVTAFTVELFPLPLCVCVCNTDIWVCKSALVAGAASLHLVCRQQPGCLKQIGNYMCNQSAPKQ